MINSSRRSFLKSLGALGAGLIVEPMIEPIIVVPERKIWVVGAQLERLPDAIWAQGELTRDVLTLDALEQQLTALIRHEDQPWLENALRHFVDGAQPQQWLRRPPRQEITILPADEPSLVMDIPVRRAQPIRATWLRDA